MGLLVQIVLACSFPAAVSTRYSALQCTWHDFQKVSTRPATPQANNLERMLQCGHSSSDILYYEILDIPLPEFEQLKTLKVRIIAEVPNSIQNSNALLTSAHSCASLELVPHCSHVEFTS